MGRGGLQFVVPLLGVVADLELVEGWEALTSGANKGEEVL